MPPRIALQLPVPVVKPCLSRFPSVYLIATVIMHPRCALHMHLHAPSSASLAPLTSGATAPKTPSQSLGARRSIFHLRTPSGRSAASRFAIQLVHQSIHILPTRSSRRPTPPAHPRHHVRTRLQRRRRSRRLQVSGFHEPPRRAQVSFARSFCSLGLGQLLLHRCTPGRARRSTWSCVLTLRTIFFWAPLAKWGLVAAGLKDLGRPAEKLSTSQNIALAATGFIWVRRSSLY